MGGIQERKGVRGLVVWDDGGLIFGATVSIK